ncbi:unnamed protein product [Rotaria socialis]|uniref:Cyclin N-terminal domain-containing protein n=2 Tax=Rotaria socialis TaxID=392032 RepID=A0A817S5V2_9BILA|nr:unnamed protein product [Rotaria socialis]CAF3356965.1 unnamed protein product [Rotaria socialis]CAF3548441.1 unnamed protein product [Rotaria socialis]CAF3771521.1 unnamed protein product [Rotaria socialis]CAF3773875.1 unnamed protein product [Rotaria socialis]
MEKQQLETMLFIEKSYHSKISIKSHSKRRVIADCLNKLTDDEHVFDDIFALTMNIFDRFISKTSSAISNDRYYQLIALSCYNIAKKLRSNVSINNENEKTSLIFSTENYSDEEIFNAEQIISNTLDWDLAYFVPHDYIQLLLKYFLPLENRAQICLHVHILLSIAICELNTLAILPSLLACACLKAAIKGLSLQNNYQIDELILKTMNCNLIELNHTQYTIEQLFQSCLQNIKPSPRRRCLAPIDTSSQQCTKVK